MLETILIATGLKAVAPTTFIGLSKASWVAVGKVVAVTAVTGTGYVAAKKFVQDKRYKALTGEYLDPAKKMVTAMEELDEQIKSVQNGSKTSLKSMQKKYKELQKEAATVISACYNSQMEEKKQLEQETARKFALDLIAANAVNKVKQTAV